MRQNFEVFVFDFDGTLVQSNEIKNDIFIEITREYHSDGTVIKKILNDDAYSTRVEILKQFFFVIFPNKDISELLSKSLSSFTILCEEAVIKVPVVNGAIETLSALKDLNKRLFISSLTPEDTLNKIVMKRGMNIYFEHIFGSPRSKVSHLKKIQDLTGVLSSDIVYIGDSNSDLAASIKFGCSYIGIGEDESIYDSKPAYFLNDYLNFFECFKNEN